jgi:hypothetical protein
MGSGAWPLATFEIPVGGAHHALIGEAVVAKMPAVAAARLVPLKTGLPKDAIDAFSLGRLSNGGGPGYADGLYAGLDATTAQDTRGFAQV